MLRLRSLLMLALAVGVANASSPSAQTPGRRPNLTGTVVAVNQQSDSVTLIDLKTMEAYRHVPVVGGPHEAAASPDGRTVRRHQLQQAGRRPAEDAERARAAERRHHQDHRSRRVPRAARRALGGSRRASSSPRRPTRRCCSSTSRRAPSSGCSGPRPACRTCWRSRPIARGSTARTCATAASARSISRPARRSRTSRPARNAKASA